MMTGSQYSALLFCSIRRRVNSLLSTAVLVLSMLKQDLTQVGLNSTANCDNAESNNYNYYLSPLSIYNCSSLDYVYSQHHCPCSLSNSNIDYSYLHSCPCRLSNSNIDYLYLQHNYPYRLSNSNKDNFHPNNCHRIYCAINSHHFSGKQNQLCWYCLHCYCDFYKLVYMCWCYWIGCSKEHQGKVTPVKYDADVQMSLFWHY